MVGISINAVNQDLDGWMDDSCLKEKKLETSKGKVM
jgi:hypothetical protein